MSSNAPDCEEHEAVHGAGFSAGDCPAPAKRLERLLTWLVDAGLTAVVFAVPLAMGGRQALGQLILVGLALAVAVCWCLRQALARQATWIRSPIDLLLAAVIALVCLQLVPLPPAVVDVVSPHLYDTLPLWASQPDSPAPFGVWTTLSLAPAATRDGLVLLAAFALLLLTTVQRVRHVADVERLIRWIAVAAASMAGFALVQYFAGNGKFFWFYEHPYATTQSAAMGSFANPNHFAQFLALGIGPLIWWMHSRSQKSSWGEAARAGSFAGPGNRPNTTAMLPTVALGLCVFAVLMSFSRGGAMAAFAAAVVCMLVLYRASLIRAKSVAVLTSIGLLVGAGLYVYGYDMVAAELDDFASLTALDKNHGRRGLWAADAAAIADYPLFGTGIGTHAEVYPIYHDGSGIQQGKEFTHAENGYIQVGLEAGLVGLLAAIVAIGFCGYWCLGSAGQGVPRRVALCTAAIAASLAASVVHSIADFVWYVPGCMVVVVILAACACRLWQMGGDGRRDAEARVPIPRLSWLAVAVCLTLVGYFMAQNRLSAVQSESSWHRYVRLTDEYPDLEVADQYAALQSMAAELSEAVRWRPSFARGHVKLAALHIELFNHSGDSGVTPLSARHVRDAALAAEFPSPAALDEWLTAAFQDRSTHLHAAWRHARQALRLCPLQGEGYIYLADLSFLEGPRSPAAAAYLTQALKVRPFDGAVLFEAGKEEALAGNYDAAFAHWKGAFRAGPVQQRALLDHLVGQASASSLASQMQSDPAILAFFLDQFQPDLPALERLKDRYWNYDRPDGMKLLLDRYVDALKSRAHAMPDDQAGKRWMKTAARYGQLDYLPDQLTCLREAVRCDSASFDARLALGKCLFKLEEVAEAEEHLTWCLQRKSHDESLQSLVQTVVERRLRGPNRSALRDPSPGPGPDRSRY